MQQQIDRLIDARPVVELDEGGRREGVQRGHRLHQHGAVLLVEGAALLQGGVARRWSRELHMGGRAGAAHQQGERGERAQHRSVSRLPFFEERVS